MWRGMIYQLTDRHEEARRVWKQAIVIAEELPDSVNQHRLIALAIMFLGDVQTSRDHYQSLFEQNPNPYFLHMHRHYLQRAKRLFPDRTDIGELADWFERKRAL